MSRHNRRRTRARVWDPSLPLHSFEPPSVSRERPDPRSVFTRHLPRSPITAKHWHNKYVAWQVRERRQKEERERLKEEQRRIFGDDSQDGVDDGLCTKMMDYFTGLDYLEK